MAKIFGKDAGGDRPEVIGRDIVNPESAPVPIDDKRYARFGWWVVLVGFVGFFAWAAFAPLDQGVPSQGTVVVSGKRQAVQNLVGGLVERIEVRDGDEVKAGDVLITLNKVQLTAQQESLRNQLDSLQARATRLEAERDGLRSLTFPEALRARANEPRAQEVMQLQDQLFQARGAALRTELAAADETIAGLRANQAGLEQILRAREQEQKMINEQLVGMRDLARDGYVARNRLLDLEATLSRLTASISETRASLQRGQSQLQETVLRRRQQQEEFQRDVRRDLTDTLQELADVRSRIDSTTFELAHTEVRAPASGIVVGLQVHTQGAVVSQGTHLMDIVPQGEPLEIESQIDPHLIDKVHPGLPVELMFTAFNQRNTPHVPGEVKTVGADVLTDPKTNMPYYPVKIQVTPEGEALLASHQVRPGMGVEVLVKTGERSMLNYLFRPIIDRAGTALVQE